MIVVNTSKELYAFPGDVSSVWYRRRRFLKRVGLKFSDGEFGSIRVGSHEEGKNAVWKIVDAVREGKTNVNFSTK